MTLAGAVLVGGRAEAVWAGGGVRSLHLPQSRGAGGWLSGEEGRRELWQLWSWRRALMNFPVGHYNFMGVICFAM